MCLNCEDIWQHVKLIELQIAKYFSKTMLAKERDKATRSHNYTIIEPRPNRLEKPNSNVQILHACRPLRAKHCPKYTAFENACTMIKQLNHKGYNGNTP